MKAIINTSCHDTHHCRSDQRTYVSRLPWVLIFQIFFHKEIIHHAYNDCIHDHSNQQCINTQVSEHQKRNNYNHIYNQRNCCCDHRDLRFTNSLKYSIGNVGHSIQKYRKGSKHQKLSGHTIFSSKQQ